MSNIFEPIVTISLAVVGLAIIAVLVSKNANTAGVLSAYGNTFGSMIGAATAPVTGSSPIGTGTGFGFPTPVLGGGMSFPQYPIVA